MLMIKLRWWWWW